MGMKLALITDVFPPLRSSGAVQLRDLSLEFARQGHRPYVFVASPDLDKPWEIEEWNGVQVVRLKAPRTKDVGYVRRALGEFLMPYAMMRNLSKSPLADLTFDGVIWYSPTIFLGPMANALKRASDCRSYLIIRDIFPQWAVDMGLMRRGLPYLFFKAVERFQYSVADAIGVQTPGNRVFFREWERTPGRKLEVLQNWLANAPVAGCSVSLKDSHLAGRKLFVYAGNMGVAQGMGRLLDLATRLRDRADLGFVFVGRGTDALTLREQARERELDNVAFYDEIDPDEIPGLYAQCAVGLIALDPRHKTHNIPGKFLSYMQAGLPVLANINAGNDLVELIANEQVGLTCTDDSLEDLAQKAVQLVASPATSGQMNLRCVALAKKMFAPEVAVHQIVAALTVSPAIERADSFASQLDDEELTGEVV